MNPSGYSASAASPKRRNIFAPKTNQRPVRKRRGLSRLANVEESAITDRKDVGRQISTEEAPSKVSVTGVVDAILEVGRQRKSLFDQMRSALLSRDDAEVIRCAGQLCGLTA
jgi:hypothetical protein